MPIEDQAYQAEAKSHQGPSLRPAPHIVVPWCPRARVGRRRRAGAVIPVQVYQGEHSGTHMHARPKAGRLRPSPSHRVLR